MSGFAALGEGPLADLPAALLTPAGTVTFRVATRGFAAKPYEAEASRFWDGRLLAGVTLEARIQPGQGGRAAQTQSEIRIWAGDAWLDAALLTHAVDGRAVELRQAAWDGLRGRDPYDCGEGASLAPITVDCGSGAAGSHDTCDLEALA